MGLEDANRQICARMQEIVRNRPLSDRELKVGCDFLDAAREVAKPNDPSWFAQHRQSIASNLKGNVVTIIAAVSELATVRGQPVSQAIQDYCERPDRVGSETWRRGIVRRRLIRQAFQAALQPMRN